MTVLSTILLFFPTCVLILTGASIVYLAYSPSIFSILAVLLSIYGLPVLVYRLHQWVFPVREGISYLRGKEYSPWWGSHQIQVIYIAIPALEALLRLIPGVFSCWLRLWGAKVGRDVYWTPGLEIADRGLLEIGDRVIVGHRIGISSHIIKPRKQNLMLYVKKVKIGNDVFLGAGSILAPGVVIGDGTFLAMATNLSPNQQVN
ncbi:MAG: acyl transferase [Mojavia pulchra JT2-VF2]|jgi:acetyltransferase-like isoleucine patch superfamily enzyme|uniref:Acyl transferase n=1 Tax=Mojavia pulchra JT2-VF2 TaxID=287848 RepID=A0A951UIT7_9NOST|nr:acyl transferase [Mojavia pulchra JT2-VF2]